MCVSVRQPQRPWAESTARNVRYTVAWTALAASVIRCSAMAIPRSR